MNDYDDESPVPAIVGCCVVGAVVLYAVYTLVVGG